MDFQRNLSVGSVPQYFPQRRLTRQVVYVLEIERYWKIYAQCREYLSAPGVGNYGYIFYIISNLNLKYKYLNLSKSSLDLVYYL